MKTEYRWVTDLREGGDVRGSPLTVLMVQVKPCGYHHVVKSFSGGSTKHISIG